MMKKIVMSCMLASFLMAAEHGSGERIQVIEGEGYQFTTVSLTDISRVHCGSGISNLVYSKEKNIEIKSTGKDAYIKILPKGIGDRLEYSKNPREVYFECGQKTYSLVLVPKDIPAQTILLKSDSVDIEKASEFEKKDSYQETLKELVKRGYTESQPDGYEVVKGDQVIRFDALTLSLEKKYLGSRYVIYEYIIEAKIDIGQKTPLQEAVFTEYLTQPLVSTIVKHTLLKGEKTRMIVVGVR